jgi:hypothetical protein
MADDLIKAGHQRAGRRDGVIDDIVRATSWSTGDGYHIAKELDRHSWWDCTLDIAEALDSLSEFIDKELAEEQRAFVADNNIQPPFSIGAHVRLSRGEAGIIDRVYEHRPASYAVKIDGDPRGEAPTMSRRIVYFDEVDGL